MKSRTLNCWKTVKSDTLQRKNEISLGVNVAKAEKSYQDGSRLNPKTYKKLVISIQAPNRGRFNDYPFGLSWTIGVGPIFE